MARLVRGNRRRAKPTKNSSRARTSRKHTASRKASNKRPSNKTLTHKKTLSPKAKEAQELKVVAKPATEAKRVSDSARKNLAQKIAETLEKRRLAKQALGLEKPPAEEKPKARRGRKPKALVEYTPTHTEDDDYSADVDYQGLEYDTGISVAKGGDDSGLSMDRFDDHEEELNFDY